MIQKINDLEDKNGKNQSQGKLSWRVKLSPNGNKARTEKRLTPKLKPQNLSQENKPEKK